MSKDDGYPAFPVQQYADYSGMSLRDYFAANALEGMIAGSQGLAITTEQFAEQSYKLADAMLKARKI